MQAVKKIGSIVISVVMWIIILVSALYAFTTLATKDDGSVSNLAGFTPMTVQSDSMSPTFDQGDLIVVKQCDTSSLQVGDIVTFHTIVDGQYALNTHRIVSIDELNGMHSFTTKGDNNDIADQHVISDGDIVGKYVLKIPYLGKVMDILSSSMGFLIIIVIPMLLFFIYQVYHLVIVGMNLKRAMAEEERQARAVEIVDSMDASADDALAKAAAAQAEAEAKLAEAKRLKAEAEAALAANGAKPGENANPADAAEHVEATGAAGAADTAETASADEERGE